MVRLGAILLGLLISAGAADAADRVERKTEPVPVPIGARSILTSSSSWSVAARETTGPDTFVLYGGPDHPTEGKFQLADGVTPDWGDGSGLPGGYGGGPDAWTPVDLTEQPTYWNIDTFNAANLNGNGAGNKAMWCGLPAGIPETEGWANAPGYGNEWFASLIYESDPVADPAAGQTVSLDFFFNHDTEPDWDFFSVEYDSGGTWTEVLSLDGSNKDIGGNFAAPGVQFSNVQSAPIAYAGNDYGGVDNDQIRIRLVFASDAAWSDQDGEFTSDAGAVQVDDISLSHVGHASLEDFEGPGPYVWNALRTSFTGDFADLYPNFTDLDPCRDNDTPVAGFLDYNQIVRNGPGAYGDTSTGGSTYYLYQYGIPGNWVANWLGGLSQGEQYLRNQIWSPPIDLDLPGPEDDDPEFEGLSLSFDVWGHLPFEHGIAFWWMVRSALPGEAWGIWTDLNQAYFSIGDPVWENIQEDLSDLVPAGADRLQVALGVWEFCCLDFVTGATPAPIFDNVTVRKYRLGGPVIAVEEQYLAQDGFPVSGSINPSTPAARDALDVPFSMARDINSSHAAIVAGDSVVCEVEAKIPGTSIADLRMFWALDTHEFFEDALRAAPARPEDQNVVTGPVGTLWTGEVVAGECRASNGTPIPDRYFFDLPDADFMYPGDVLRYYIQATDNDGRVTTMPSDTSDFMNVPNPDGFEGNFFYDRRFVVRALPTFDDGPVPQVQTLAVLATGSDAENDAIIRTFMRAYYLEGQLYDSYTVRAPDYNLSNGIGSAGVHGATAGQLAGYEHIFVFTGDRPRAVLSDGTGYNFNDKGNDIGVLDAWVDLEGPRNLAFFGDHVATGLITDGSHIGAQFVADRMGVLVGDDDVSDVIDNQRSPLVVPYWSFPDAFDADFVVEGGCPSWHDFDQIQPAPGAYAGHVFTNYAGVPYAPTGDPAVGGVASVINDYRIATFPFSLGTIPVDEYGRRSSALLGEVMGLFSMPWVACDPYPCTGTTPDRGPAKLSASPNPFNPSTLVKFTVAPGSKGTVKVFNLRGELVRTLHSGEFAKQEFRWEGTDSRGAPVASGVYMIQATDGTVTKTQKVALVK